MSHDTCMTDVQRPPRETALGLPAATPKARSAAGTLAVSPDRLKYWLLSLFVTLLALHGTALFVAYGLGYDVAMGFVPAFHMDWERNVPTYASMFLLLSCGILAALQPTLGRSDRREVAAWRVIGIIFVLLSADEAFQLHEPVSAAVKAQLQADWVPLFAWVIPYGAALVVLAIVFLPWFIRLDRPSQVRFGLAAIIYLTGAMGLEIISSAYFESLDPDREQFRTLTGGLLATAEESLELIGISIFLHALVRRAGGLKLSVGAR